MDRAVEQYCEGGLTLFDTNEQGETIGKNYPNLYRISLDSGLSIEQIYQHAYARNSFSKLKNPYFHHSFMCFKTLCETLLIEGSLQGFYDVEMCKYLLENLYQYSTKYSLQHRNSLIYAPQRGITRDEEKQGVDDEISWRTVSEKSSRCIIF